MASGGVAIAIAGATSEIGRDLREVLNERALPVASLRLYDEAAAIVDGEAGEDATAVEPCDDGELAAADIVFVCRRAVAAAAAAVAERGESVVIDLAQAIEEEVFVVPEVNAEVVGDALDQGLALATPLPAATALAVALAPIEATARLRRLAVTCLEPVSTTPGGVEELARQTGDLLSGRDAEAQLWPQRIAFNLLPAVGELSATGASEREWQIQRQLRLVLDLPDLPIATHVVRVPTFYGHAMTVDAETDEPIDGESAAAVLRAAPGVHLHAGEASAASLPTLSEAVGSAATHVGRVREDPTVPCGLSLWLAVDGLRKGTTVNAAQIAECVLRARPLGR